MTRTRGASSAPRSRAVARSLPQEETGPRLRLHSRRRVSGRAVALWGAAFFFVVLAGSVAIQAQRIETQHRIDRVEAELQRADELNRRLRTDVAVAQSPERIIDAARALGMVDPGPVVPLLPQSPQRADAPVEVPPTLLETDAGAIDVVAQGAAPR